MEHDHFDRIARAMAAGVSRRSMLRRAARSAMTSPLGLFGISAAAAQGNSNKDNEKGTTPPGNARRCTKAQTAVTTRTEVCTDNCPQTVQQTVLVENAQSVAR